MIMRIGLGWLAGRERKGAPHRERPPDPNFLPGAWQREEGAVTPPLRGPGLRRAPDPAVFPRFIIFITLLFTFLLSYLFSSP